MLYCNNFAEASSQNELLRNAISVVIKYSLKSQLKKERFYLTYSSSLYSIIGWRLRLGLTASHAQ